MFKRMSIRFKQRFIPFMLIFIIGDICGSYSSYLSINKDCMILGIFRINEIAYSCKKHIP